MIKIFCVTNKPLPILEKSALNLAGVGEHDFSSNYINSKIKNNIHHKEKFYSELTFHYWYWKNLLMSENSAISKNNEINFLYCVKDKFLENYQDHIKGINSHDIKHLLNHNVKESHIEKIKVETLTFENLIKKYDLTDIDLLYIDGEGYYDKIVLDFL